MYSRLWVVWAFLFTATGHLHAEPAPQKYNAFDLARRDLEVVRNSKDVRDFVHGVVVLGFNELPRCQPEVSKTSLSIKGPPAGEEVCELFLQPVPAKFLVERAQALATKCDKSTLECASEIVVNFDKGSPIEGVLSGSTIQFVKYPVSSGDVCVSYFADKRWNGKDLKVANQQVVLPDPIPTEADVYIHDGACTTTPTVFYELVAPKEHLPPASGFPVENLLPGCKQIKGFTACDPFPEANDTWDLWVDQANDQSIPRISLNRNNYINPNSFGRVWIRHWKSVTPTVLITGAGTTLTAVATEVNAAVTDASTLGPALVSSLSDGERISVVLVPPHSAGTMHLTVKFADAIDATKPKGDVSTELIVDKAYFGTFRFGVSHVFFSPEANYTTVKRTDLSPSEIVKRGGNLNEIVLGYSLYLDGFKINGRRYFLTDEGAAAFFARHLGIYAGFGAVSYSPGSFDFLKSLHLGLEWEFSRNISLAATFVLRRSDHLADGYAVGGPAPASGVPTETRYVPGLGVVLNFSVDFLKTVSGVAKQ